MGDTVENNEEATGQLKRTVVLFGAILGVVVLIAGVIIWSPWSSDGTEKDSEVAVRPFTLAADDAGDIESIANDTLEKTGNFGVDPNRLTNNNLQEIGYTVTRQDTGWDDYMITRSASYDSARDSIMRTSPVDHDRSMTAKWDTGDELETLKSFELKKSTVEVPEEGTIEPSTDGEDARYVRVKVDFTSTVTQRLVTAEDTSWDGSYRILQKDLNGTATFVFRDYAGEWLLYDIENPTNEFLLSLWVPNFTDEYTSKMFDFREVEIVTPDNPYEPKAEGK